MSKRHATASRNDVFFWLPWLAAAAAALAFLPSIFNGFVWDDEVLLVGNHHFRGFGFPQLAWMFSAPRFGQYHPLTWLSFAVDQELFGMQPAAFHAVNLLIHAANAVLFFWIAGLLLRKAAPDANKEAIAFGAAFAALFFAVHPLRTETVAWVTERRGLLSSFFLFAALLAYLKEALVPSLVCYALSLLSKATGVVFPAVLLLVDHYPLRRSGRRVWIEKTAYVLVAIPFALIAPFAQNEEGAMQSFASYGLFARLGQAGYGAIYYLWKTLAPWRLSPFVRFPDHVNFLGDAPIAFSLVACLAITAGVIALRHARPAALVLWGTYLSWLAPVSGLFQSGPHFVADRYTYLACLGWALAGGGAFAWAVQRRRNEALAAAGVLFVVFGALSWAQSRVWRSAETLWSHALKLDPRSYLAHNNLCIALREAGRRDEAYEHCRAALDLRPEYPQARCNLGTLLLDDGKTEEALAQFHAAVKLAPKDPVSWFDLGVAYERMGRMDDAVRGYETAVNLKPDYAAARNNLGAALSRQSRSDAAAREFERTVALDPSNAKAHFNLGNVYYERRRFDDAAREFERALRIAPNDARTHLNLGASMNALGRPADAIEQFRTAIRLQPDFSEAYNNLGISLFQLGRYKEAVSSFERALKLKPDYPDARFNLNRAASLLGSSRPAR